MGWLISGMEVIKRQSFSSISLKLYLLGKKPIETWVVNIMVTSACLAGLE